MPKGRGSNHRRRTLRQKYARYFNSLPSNHPLAEEYDIIRSERMHGKFKGKVKGKHPLENPKERANRRKLVDKHDKKAADRVAENAARRRENWT